MMLLDIVEVAKSHSGINLAAAFAKILDEFGISDKVGCKNYYETSNSPNLIDPQYLSPAIMHQIMIQ